MTAAFYLGLALTASATLALEILQARILSVVSWYHLSFFVISIAMFGLAAGGLYVYARPERFADASAPRELVRHALYGAFAVPLAYIDQIALAPEPALSAAAAFAFFRLALSVSIPFFFSGIVVTLALTRLRLPVARAYAAALAGASAGCLGVIVLLELLDAAGAIFAIAAIFAAAAACFATWSRDLVPRRSALLAAAFLLALAAVDGITPLGFDPILVKGRVEQRSEIAFERWNTLARVTGRAPQTVPAATALWAPSPVTPNTAVEVVSMAVDGEPSSTLAKMSGRPASVAYLAYDATATAYVLRRGSVAVIGVGIGKDVMTALAFWNQRVLGVERNPAFIEGLYGPYRDFTGLVFLHYVRLVVDDGRSYMARSRESFDILQLSLSDSWAATGAGAIALSENAHYTVEAWRIFLSRLKPTGILTTSHWHAQERPDETARLLSLASAALLASGVETPSEHLALVTHGGLGTLLASRAPLRGKDLTDLREHCRKRGFTMVLDPDQAPESPWLKRIRAARSAAELEQIGRDAPLDLTPPTDDRPFFFNLLRLSRVSEVLPRIGGVLLGNLTATLTLFATVLASLALAGLVLVLPGRCAAGRVPPNRDGRLYFALIGAGFMFVEIGFLQRLSPFLGHPVYALSVVPFWLILFTGFGSYFSPRLGLDRGRRLHFYGPALALLLIASSLALARFLPGLEGSTRAVRVLVAVAFLAPAGLLMGQALPSGIARFGAARDAAPWLLAIHGAAGVAASTAAVAVSIAFGISATSFVGAAFYALLPLTLRSSPPAAAPADAPASSD